MAYSRSALKVRIVAFLLAFLLPMLGQAKASQRSVEKQFEQLSHVEQSTFKLSTTKQAAAISETYDRLFGRKNRKLGLISRSNLRLLYRAAYIASFYTFSPKYRRDMAKILAALEERDAATRQDYSHMYGALIAARKFAEARRFYHAHPNLKRPPPPKYEESPRVNGHHKTVLIISPRQRKLVRKKVEFKQAQIIVVADPLCHFSRYGLHDIESDPVLARIFKTHAIWLAPTEHSLHLDVLQKWNAHHPDVPFVLAYRQTDWPKLYNWKLPTFYFFKNGALVASIVGWSKEGDKKELKADLREIGLASGRTAERQ
jgi:hypothetical protein